MESLLGITVSRVSRYLGYPGIFGIPNEKKSVSLDFIFISAPSVGERSNETLIFDSFTLEFAK